MEAQASSSAPTSGVLNLDVWHNFFLAAGFGEIASSQYAAIFKAHEMEIDMVADLTHEVLLQMGFTKAGPRIKIMRLKEAIVNPKNGEIVTDATDTYVQVSSFNYGGKIYKTNGAVAPSPEQIPVVNKPILIPLTLDKRKASHSSAQAESPTKSLQGEAMVRPASTSVLVQAGASKPDAAAPTHTFSASTNQLEAFNVASYQVQHASAPASPEQARKIGSGLSASSSAIHGSLLDLQMYQTDAEAGPVEGTFTINPETGEFVPSPSPAPSTLGTSSGSLNPGQGSPQQTYATVTMSGLVTANSASPAPGQQSVSASAAAAASSVMVVRYFINDEVAKHRVRVIGEAAVGSFSQLLKTQHKLSDFAIFMFDQAENRLRVLKDSTVIDGAVIYYVLENSKIDDLYRKVEKRVKKDLAALNVASGKTSTWNSENNPLRVDFIPDSELYLTEAGRIGLCMCPGRKKKKTAHEWDRDLDKDLLRMRDYYKCDVVVSLVRRSELVELKIPTLLEEVEKLGMESIHFPIKDKWVPDSMAGVIALVDTLIHRLKVGKTIVIHCNGGKGRSGTVAVACMVAMGKRVVQSIDVVRKARSGTIRNPAQIFYVKRFKTAFKNYQKKKAALIESRGALAPKDWEALAEQVASDPALDAESDSDSEMSEVGSKKEDREREKAAEKQRKEAEKAHEKLRKEEEKAAEKQRKEEEKAEKAQEKAREKEEKAQRKEEEKKDKRGSKIGTPGRGSAEIDAAALATVSASPIPFEVQNLTQSEETSAADAKPVSEPKPGKRAKQDKSAPSTPHSERGEKPALTVNTAAAAATAAATKPDENGAAAEVSSPKRAAARRKSVKEAKKTNTIGEDAIAGSAGSD